MIIQQSTALLLNTANITRPKNAYLINDKNVSSIHKIALHLKRPCHLYIASLRCFRLLKVMYQWVWLDVPK